MSRISRWLRPAWVTGGATTGYALLLEYLQSFQPLRFLDLWDALAGALGAAAAVVVLYRLGGPAPGGD